MKPLNPHRLQQFNTILNLMCTYTVVTHPRHISPLAQARPMMLCIYISFKSLGRA